MKIKLGLKEKIDIKGDNSEFSHSKCFRQCITCNLFFVLFGYTWQ